MRNRIPHFSALALIPALFLATGCSEESPSNTEPPLETVESLFSRFPIDGEVDLDAVGVVESAQVTLKDGLGNGSDTRVATLRWAMANDDVDVYFALEWDDPDHDNEFDITSGPVEFDGIRLLFDNDGDGTFEVNEDNRVVIAASISSQFVDGHNAAPGTDETDLVGDGFARLGYDEGAGLYSAEFLVPQADDVNGEDGPIGPDTRVNVMLMDGVRLSTSEGEAGTVWSMVPGVDEWTPVELADVTVTNRPTVPADPGGLVVFLSDDDTPNGEIYSFDPATSMTRRVTTLPGLFKDNISLSHDRTRVAFHGASAIGDYAGYEIYTVGIDGTGLRQLTDNEILDGHPAWSPDDTEICFASFREGGGSGATLVVIDTAGVEIADLTPPGTDDNDADYLPDGRIVFKTDRFTEAPEVRIAIMNADGTGAVEMSHVSGVSDHDPVGNSSTILFERFPKNTNYATDPETGFIGWDVVEIDMTSGQERTLMSDGWINWLPVHSPGGEWIAYLKGSGQTAVHIMTAEGEEIGRFVPNHTRVRYLDWK